MKLLTTENAKTSKGTKLGYLTGILYLAPHNIAGYGTICPASTAGCRKACLYSAGRGAFKSIQQSRIIKTIHLMENRVGFIEQLNADIQVLKRKAKKLGLKPAIRLNGTSDIAWHRIAFELFTTNSDIQFYDYTKVYSRMLEVLPLNYHLTYSVSEVTAGNQLVELNKLNRVVAVVQKGLEVYNGDEHDLRFLNSGVVYLRPKGQAKKDLTGFVQS